jgi:hypothetical protein
MRSQAQTPKCASPAMRGAATLTAAVHTSSFPHAEVRRTTSEDQRAPAQSIVLAMHQPTLLSHPRRRHGAPPVRPAASSLCYSPPSRRGKLCRRPDRGMRYAPYGYSVLRIRPRCPCLAATHAPRPFQVNCTTKGACFSSTLLSLQQYLPVGCDHTSSFRSQDWACGVFFATEANFERETQGSCVCTYWACRCCRASWAYPSL